MPTPGRYDGRPMRRLRAQVKREEGICWLCGKPIDPDLAAPHPHSFSLDHVRPVSTGATPAERRALELDRANARAAHRICNMRRGIGRRQAAKQSRDW